MKKINPSDDSASHVALAKNITLINGINIIVGSIIGSGIFITPSFCIRYAGSVGGSILIWLLSGCLVLFGALSFAELGTTIPQSGGEYTYIRVAFGPFLAFLCLWVNILVVRPVLIAITLISFGEYIFSPFFTSNVMLGPSNIMATSANELITQNASYSIVIRIAPFLGLLFLVAINCYNVKWATKLQDALTVAKVLALIGIIVIGFIRIFQGHTMSFKNPFADTNDIRKISLAFYSGLFSYGGWNFLNIITGEMKNPNRDLPLSIIIGIPIVTLIYVLTNIAYLAVLSPAQMKQSTIVAFGKFNLFKDDLDCSRDFAINISPYLAYIMPILAALSAFGSANAILFTSGRIFYIGAQNGHLPRSIAMINVKYLTPIPAILSLGFIAMFYMTGINIDTLIKFMSFIFYTFTAICILALFYLRWKRPDIPRPIKFNPMVHLVFLFPSAFILITSLVSDYRDIALGLIILLIGIPVYMLFIKPSTSKKCCFRGKSCQSSSESLTIFLQKLLMITEANEDEPNGECKTIEYENTQPIHNTKF